MCGSLRLACLAWTPPAGRFTAPRATTATEVLSRPTALWSEARHPDHVVRSPCPNCRVHGTARAARLVRPGLWCASVQSYFLSGATSKRSAPPVLARAGVASSGGTASTPPTCTAGARAGLRASSWCLLVLDNPETCVASIHIFNTHRLASRTSTRRVRPRLSE
jgi:hypothetical protein